MTVGSTPEAFDWFKVGATWNIPTYALSLYVLNDGVPTGPIVGACAAQSDFPSSLHSLLSAESFIIHGVRFTSPSCFHCVDYEQLVVNRLFILLLTPLILGSIALLKKTKQKKNIPSFRHLAGKCKNADCETGQKCLCDKHLCQTRNCR